MDLADLFTFEQIAILGNMSLAARQVGRTQPALTKCVDRLEAELGAPLLRRSGRLLKLTESGEVLLANAIRMRQAATETKQQIADLASGKVGVVRIGIGAPALEYLLPDVVSKVIRDAPRARFELTVGTSDVLDTALRQGEIDVRIGPSPAALDTALDYRPVWHEETVIAARHGHALARPGIAIRDLEGAGWALPKQPMATRYWLNALLQQNGLPPPRIVIEANLIQIQSSLIVATDLLTIIARRSLVSTAIGRQLAELPLPDAVFTREFGICWRRDGYLPPATQRLVSVLVDG